MVNLRANGFFFFLAWNNINRLLWINRASERVEHSILATYLPHTIFIRDTWYVVCTLVYKLDKVSKSQFWTWSIRNLSYKPIPAILSGLQDHWVLLLGDSSHLNVWNKKGGWLGLHVLDCCSLSHLIVWIWYSFLVGPHLFWVSLGICY
jgi:hypothetical protein